jgi:hypothetical protein
MSNTIDISKMNIDSDIPTGSWTLYFHSPEDTKWTLNTFVNLGSMKTWRDFWTVIDALKAESLSDGMFFMMRDPSPPLWESHQNIRGGCYSFRCQKKDASEIYISHIIAAMLNSLTKNTANRINGISISPKRGFNIIKIWNTDAQAYNTTADIHANITSVTENEILYTPFIQKRMT